MLKTNRPALIVSGADPATDAQREELAFVVENFFGTVFSSAEEFCRAPFDAPVPLYVIGDAKAIMAKVDGKKTECVKVVSNLSHSVDTGSKWEMITSGQVPMNMHGVGVFFRQVFGDDTDYFGRIHDEHAFQDLGLGAKKG